MTKRKFINLTLGLAVAISPLAVVMACANSSENETVSQVKPTTIKQSQFLASAFNFNQPIEEVEKLINEEWVLANKQMLLNSSDQLTNTNQILNLNVSKNQAVLNVSFQLASGSYIDQNSQVGSQPSPAFKFTIINFISNSQPDLPPTIDLDLIISQATFSVTNKSQLASKVKPEQLIWDQAATNSEVTFQVDKLFADDQNGWLGYQIKFNQKSDPSNQKNLIINPNHPKAITGFQTTPAQPDELNALEQEVARLIANANQVINVTKLTTIDIINYRANPTTFINQLQTLKPDQFNYEITKFDVDNKQILTIDLLVQKGSAIKTISLSKQIEEIKVNINDPQWLVQNELSRLNRLIKQSILLKSTFNEDEVKQLKQTPNFVLGYLFNFVSTFGFHYQVDDLAFSKPNDQGQAKLSFKIKAKFWKTTNSNKPIITSNSFSYDVILIKSQDNIDAKPPVATTEGWKIEPSANAIPGTNPDGSLDGSYSLEIDLKEDKQIDFADPSLDSEALIKKIFTKKQDLFINVKGKLDPNWNWDNYVYFQTLGDIKNDQDQLVGFEFYGEFSYVDSDLLSKPTEDNSLVFYINIVNGYNSGQAPAKPTPEETWNDLKTKFSDLIKNQAIDEDKLHLDRSGNGIMSFAQISADDNITRSDHFSNFLNFSPTEFKVNNGFLVDVKAKNASINYLTNEIKFTWVLEGLNNSNLGINLSSYQQEFPNQIIKYQPKDKWADQIRFDSTDPQLQIRDGIAINNILDRFGLSNRFVSETILKDRFQRFGTNWTWKARELANYLRFTFYQAFNDGADAINMAIVGINPNNIGLNQNPQNYQLVLKARLNTKAQGNYLPYLQEFGTGAQIQSRNWKVGEIVEIRLNISAIPETPGVVTNANEILPGLGPGNVLGTGQGALQAYLDTPPRNDLYNIALGTHQMSIKVNDQPYLNNQSANHRFIAFNMLSRYDFKDPLNPEPTPEAGWTSGNL